MQLKCYLMCFAFLFIAAPTFAVKLTNASAGYNAVQVYNNTDSRIYFSSGIGGADLANLSQKFDCGDQYSTACVGWLPKPDDIYIDPGKGYTFAVVSRVKSMRNIEDFIRGAVILNIETPQHLYTRDQIVLPVAVNMFASHLTDWTTENTNRTQFYMGASTQSSYLEHPKYIVSVTFYYSAQYSRQTITVIVSNAPDLTSSEKG
jgi:hypothetical protein